MMSNQHILITRQKNARFSKGIFGSILKLSIYDFRQKEILRQNDIGGIYEAENHIP